MYIIEVVPLVRLPKGTPTTFTYFTSQHAPAGSFVFVPIQKRKVVGVVIQCTPLSDAKATIRKQDFSLKKIYRTIDGAKIPERYIKLYLWTEKFFLAQKNLVFKTALPNYFTNPTETLAEFLESTHVISEIPERPSEPQSSHLIEGAYQDRTHYYIKKIQEVTQQNPHAQILALFPTQFDAERFYETIQQTLDMSVITYGSWHTERKQADYWKEAVSASARVIIGTRNAIFIPIPLLSLIIIDNEASSYYKSWDAEPFIDVRDIAEKIADAFRVPLIVGGGIFRQETWYRKTMGELPAENIQKAHVPVMTVIDIKKEKTDTHEFKTISTELAGKINQTLEKKQKIFLFLGRRGHSANILCSDCGYTALCKNCQAPLVVHLGKDVLTSRFLLCHRCLHKELPPTACPECGGGRIQAFGIGSQKIEEDIYALFPNAKIMRIDSDTSEDPNNLHERLTACMREEYNILIGTEIALKPSCALNFGLSVIVSLHQLLQQPDFRQEEKIFFIVEQLAEMTPGEIVIQTSSTHIPLIKEISTYDIEAFMKRDNVSRKAFFYPPFAEIIKITTRNPIRLIAEKNSLVAKTIIAEEFTKAGVAKESLFLIGPIPAFIPREKNEFIYHIILKVRDQNHLVKETLIQKIPPFITFDVNPKTVL